MKNIKPCIWIFISFAMIQFFSCNTTNPNNSPQQQPALKKSNPPSPPIIGVNIGKEYDQMGGKHPIINHFKHLRVFLLLEDVYNGKYPSANDPHYNPENLDSWDYSMMGYRQRFQQMKEQGFDVRISLEAIFEKHPSGKVIRHRKFPNKSFSRAEWGGTEKAIKANAKKLAIAIDRMYGDYISRLEFTNEAWGEPGIEATQWIIRGLIDGLEEVNSELKLSLGAYQAYQPNARWKCTTCKYESSDYIGKIYQPWMAKYIDELTVHPYSFKLGTTQLTEAPLKNPNSEFKYLNDMLKWRDQHCPNLNLSITEIGWNSHEVGETLQTQYLNQVIEEATRLGIYSIYLYEAVDSPTDGLFKTCGVFKTDNVARKPSTQKDFLVKSPFSLKNQVE